MDSGKIFKKLRLAQKVYDENFLNKEFLYIYENKNEIKKFSITFKKQNFLHLTGIKYDSKDNMNPLDFYRAVKEKRLSLSEKNINDFTNIKLKVFPKLINLLQESSVFYKFSPEKGNTNWLYINSFITENQRKEESIILGITEKGENTNNYAPWKTWDRKKEIDIEGTQISARFIEEEKVIEKSKDKRIEIGD